MLDTKIVLFTATCATENVTFLAVLKFQMPTRSIFFELYGMFIKKDRRKINDIFREEGSAIESLKLSKRKAEFQGSLRIICHESKAKLLGNLKVLNLYDNDLNSVDGIGILAQTPVEDINLGCNKLAKLPLEVRRDFSFYHV